MLLSSNSAILEASHARETGQLERLVMRRARGGRKGGEEFLTALLQRKWFGPC